MTIRWPQLVASLFVGIVASAGMVLGFDKPLARFEDITIDYRFRFRNEQRAHPKIVIIRKIPGEEPAVHPR